ncbi:hypothetical protein LJB92_04530 [Bacteroidales bacterium OttesenSCG-928-M06]|nr:hypothetical protein [Bacteroidales bacterium OttesenSCG-928-M06]
MKTMKLLYIISISIIFISCKKSSECIYNTTQNAYTEESNSCKIIPIDTIEFSTYWNQFRVAIIAKDIPSLHPLIEDSLDCDCFFLYPIVNSQERFIHLKKKDTNTKLKYVLDQIFTPPFLSLLKIYNPSLSKDSVSKYKSEILIEKDLYYSETSFLNKNEVMYKMGVSSNNEYSSSEIVFLFRKGKNRSIKLYKIECYSSTIVSI